MTDTTNTMHVCGCVTPCDTYCAAAVERMTNAMISDGIDTEVIASGILRNIDPTRATMRVRFNYEGRILYDARNIARAGSLARLDGHTTYGRDVRTQTLLLESGRSDDDAGTYAESGVTIAADMLATDELSRGDAANRLADIVAMVSKRSATFAADTAFLVEYASQYANASGTAIPGSVRQRAYLARKRVTEALSRESDDIREETRATLGTLGMERQTTRPDARGGDGSGRNLRDGRSLATRNRAQTARAAGAAGM